MNSAIWQEITVTPAAVNTDDTIEGRHRTVFSLLGLSPAKQRVPRTKIEVHDFLTEGLPAASLVHVVKLVGFLREEAPLRQALGVSPRTFHRMKEHPEKSLPLDVSGRLWRFAEFRAKATDILGSGEAADRWLTSPAMALDRKRPIDLMATPAGADLVGELLDRMDTGTYT